MALGGLALADGPMASAVFTNPARFASIDSLQTAYTQTRLSVDHFDFAVSGAFPIFPGLAVGLGWNALAVQNQAEYGIVRDSNGQIEVDPGTGQPLTQALGFFTQNDNQFSAAVAAQFGFISLGADLTYELVDFGETEGSGWGFDLSSEWNLNSNNRLALILDDPGNRSIYFNNGAASQLVVSQWAAAWSCQFARLGSVSLTAEPGFRKDLWDGAGAQWGMGLEAAWLDDVFLRAGLNNTSASFGVGLVAHPEKVFKEIRLDYAYLTQTTDGYPSRLSVSVKW